MENNTDKKKFQGEIKNLVSPSGFTFIIREQTGDDDDILSNGAYALENTSAAHFLSSIVIKTDYTESGKLSVDDAMTLKLCDKYFLIIASRIFSIGQILKFDYKWPDIAKAIGYEEDLLQYIWEYGDTNLTFPTEGEEGYFEFRIPPHKHGKDRTLDFTTSTGKVLRFSFSNSKSEAYLGKLTPEQQSKNNELKSRFLSQKIGESWVIVESFKSFTPFEMLEIRNTLFENDPILQIYSEIKHPISGVIEYMPILGTPDFFYPREI